MGSIEGQRTWNRLVVRVGCRRSIVVVSDYISGTYDGKR
jgi:hypothetical protein